MSLRRLLLAGMAALALSAMSSPAHASRAISISPGGNITLTGSIATVFNGLLITCPITFYGTLPTSITKVVGTPVGHFWGMPSGTICNNGWPVTFLPPWRYQYRGVTGTLPNIGHILLRYTNVGLLVHGPNPGIYNCLYGGTLDGWLSMGGGALPPPGPPLERRSGGFFCPATLAGVFSGSVSPRQTFRLV